MPDDQKRANTYGWFIPALMSLTEESTIYLGEGIHYIQTNEGDRPYYEDELQAKCFLPWSMMKQASEQAYDVFTRRNPLRFLNYEASNPGNPVVDEGNPDLENANYGATFKITVKTWRCADKGITSCVMDPET